MASGPGIYFDGVTSARHDVTVEAEPGTLRIRGADNALLAQWPTAELRGQSAPADVLRLARAGNPVLARLDIRDAALANAIGELAASLDRTGRAERRNRKKVIAWSFAATVSLILVAVFGVPEVIARATPLIPLRVEYRLGMAIDSQMRAALDTGRRSGKPFECGLADGEKPGRAAVDKIVKQLEAGAQLPIPLHASVVRRSEANAIALPGGHVYVYEGLIAKANTPDELAAVLAHEIGHVAHRDGMRSVLEAAGLSFLFGMLLGDFTGGGLVVIAARQVTQSAYSRDVERAADLYGVQLMARIGGDPRALGTILDRIAGAIEPGYSLVLDHPLTKDRIAVINAAAPTGPRKPLVGNDEWAALKKVCSS